VPGWLAGVGWSDHWSFWQEGYPAIMVTDTALFRYPHYHAPTDTPDKIDYDRMSRVVSGLVEVIADLADADQ
jgi:Peptidase family M28